MKFIIIKSFICFVFMNISLAQNGQSNEPLKLEEVSKDLNKLAKTCIESSCEIPNTVSLDIHGHRFSVAKKEYDLMTEYRQRFQKEVAPKISSYVEQKSKAARKYFEDLKRKIEETAIVKSDTELPDLFLKYLKHQEVMSYGSNLKKTDYEYIRTKPIGLSKKTLDSLSGDELFLAKRYDKVLRKSRLSRGFLFYTIVMDHSFQQAIFSLYETNDVAKATKIFIEEFSSLINPFTKIPPLL